MAIALEQNRAKPTYAEVTTWSRLKTNRNWLAIWFMLPAAAFLILFLAYPLGLGVWLSFTDARLGRDGIFIGFENYEYLWEDSTFWLSVFNTLLYTGVASIIKFAVGLYLALLLNERLPFKAIIRAVVLIPSSCQRCYPQSRSGGCSTRSFRLSRGRSRKCTSSRPISTSSATCGMRAAR